MTNEMELRKAFIGAMRSVANSVTIVSTNGPAGKFGATVSSFCSVSADPPTVLACLNIEGHTAHAIRENKTFCVNVLSEDLVDLAEHFAGMRGGTEFGRFTDEKWSEDPKTPPSLTGVTSFSCDVVQTIDAGSHLIFIGTVGNVQISDQKPLLYLNQKFCRTDTAE
ncbi:MAG: flavin reductase family protein [Pseudomonadota bacterium]